MQTSFSASGQALLAPFSDVSSHILVPSDSDEYTLVARCHFYFTSSHPPFLVKEYPSGM